ncbi:MAG: ribonuclease Y [Phycisphaerales bacterium]|jgi:ribonuclease Y|nr:ribonuclease Y [Phycisphaerales bacterium]
MPEFLALVTESVIAAVALIVGAAIGWILLRMTAGGTVRRARSEAEQLIAAATTEGEAERRRIELEAERKSRDRREEVDREVSEAQANLRKDQERMSKREDAIDEKGEQLTRRESRLDEREEGVQAKVAALQSDAEQLDVERSSLRTRLEAAAGLSQGEAREQLLDEIRDDAEHDAKELTQKILEDAEDSARSRSREITLQAIQRFAAEHVADTTVRSVRIPSDDMKGRIIGREGRNIRALERATGVDILVDDTPGVIAVSCFDPIRRAIAGESLEKLVADGRVHPSRIEEVVETVRRDMHERIQKAGNDAVMEANIRGLHPKIVEAMGRLHFRTSYGQNVLRHSIEVAFLSQVIADQLQLDGELARRCGFLHDIGKAMDHEAEGTHPQIGKEFCGRYGEKAEAVINAVAGHHGDIPATTAYTPIVMAADAISGARPGARRESMEMYVKRLEQLEDIAKEQRGVTQAHAIQAGREVRVIVDAKDVDDAESFAISKRIAERIEEEMTFPGEIKVTVLREVRAEAVAR